MPKPPARFTQAEIERCIRAAQSCGVPVNGIGFDVSGNIRTFGDPAGSKPSDPIDEWLADNEDGSEARPRSQA